MLAILDGGKTPGVVRLCSQVSVEIDLGSSLTRRYREVAPPPGFYCRAHAHECSLLSTAVPDLKPKIGTRHGIAENHGLAILAKAEKTHPGADAVPAHPTLDCGL